MVERKFSPLRPSEPFSFRAERMPAIARESCVSPLSPVRYGRKQRRISRGISAFSRFERKPTDWVADSAVCCEPRENTGNFTIFGPILTGGASRNSLEQGAF